MADLNSWDVRNLAELARQAEEKSRRHEQLAQQIQQRLETLQAELERLQAELETSRKDRRMALERWRETCRMNEALVMKIGALERKAGER